MKGIPQGFTLVEVLVALAIGAMLLLGARAVLEQVADAADRTAAAAASADRVANTDRTVRALFLRTVAADDSTPFSGGSSAARFTSWCDVPGGWTERCTVTVGVVPAAVSDRGEVRTPPHAGGGVGGSGLRVAGPLMVVVWTSAGDTMVLREHAPLAALRYLTDAADGGHWAVGWSGRTETPVAVGLVTDHDTVVLRVGERR